MRIGKIKKKINKLYWKIWSWYHYDSPIFINTVNIFNPLSTWKKAKQYFNKPRISFRYGKIQDCLSSSIYHDYINTNRKLFSLTFNDVLWKWKYDNICFEAEPFIILTIFNNWKFIWIFKSPTHNSYCYWEALLDYVYDYKDIIKTKEEFSWVSFKTDENGNEYKVTCWDDNWLTDKGKELTKNIIK